MDKLFDEAHRFRVVGTLECCETVECEECGSEYEKEWQEKVDLEVWAPTEKDAIAQVEAKFRDVIFISEPRVTDYGPMPMDQIMRKLGAPLLPGMAEL